MNRFLMILKKEIRELITVQAIIPLVLIFALFNLMGGFITSFTEDTKIEVSSSDIEASGQQSQGDSENSGDTVSISKNSIIGLIDNDNSEMSNYVIDMLKQYGWVLITPSSGDTAIACQELENYVLDGNEVEIKTLIVMNKGFEESIRSSQVAPIDMYSTLNSFGVMSTVSSSMSSSISQTINSIVSDKLFNEYTDGNGESIYYMKSPTYERSYTYMNGKTAQINSGAILGYITSNTTFVPIIVFLIIMYSMQTLATSMVNEKADKTLETLMTTPVNRMAVLFAKILAAALYAIVYAIAYIFAFRNYMNGLMGGGTYSSEMIKIIEDFGISFDVSTFLLIGVQLFLSVLCGLGIALILGMMIDDMKSLQAYIMPLMLLIMIPYFVSMLVDINTLPVIFKTLIYLIPFTHTFAAATNIFAQNYALMIGGMIYQVIFVVVMMTIAIKIFNSDKLITLSEIIKSKSAKKKAGGIKGLKLR